MHFAFGHSEPWPDLHFCPASIALWSWGKVLTAPAAVLVFPGEVIE
jgi:hypothetical protein